MAVFAQADSGACKKLTLFFTDDQVANQHNSFGPTTKPMPTQRTQLQTTCLQAYVSLYDPLQSGYRLRRILALFVHKDSLARSVAYFAASPQPSQFCCDHNVNSFIPHMPHGALEDSSDSDRQRCWCWSGAVAHWHLVVSGMAADFACMYTDAWMFA